MDRWEIIRQKPIVVLDVAHNVDGIRQLITRSKTLFIKNFISFLEW